MPARELRKFQAISANMNAHYNLPGRNATMRAPLRLYGQEYRLDAGATTPCCGWRSTATAAAMKHRYDTAWRVAHASYRSTRRMAHYGTRTE